MILNMRYVAPARGYKTESLSVIRDESGHAAGMDAGGEVHEAVEKDDGARIREERSVGVL